jgi:hypothetical protein
MSRFPSAKHLARLRRRQKPYSDLGADYFDKLDTNGKDFVMRMQTPGVKP